MDKVVAVGKLVATFAVGKIFPAGFAINIPLPVNDVVIFIVDEVFSAVGALFQVFVPAIRAEVKLPVDFEFFRCSADVTFHDSLHWLVVTTPRRHFAGNRVALLKFFSSSLSLNSSGNSIFTNRRGKVNESRHEKKPP